ncbi:MAG TPA: flagellar hook-associated protein FlgK, partial [Planctomycetota bacterium]|nr:flagellar hook-associated protein FlgK [Planctomycetota bacterium]
MTYGFGLGAGLKALTAARLAIQTAGHNIANANTEGYSRQRVLQSASLPFTIGRFQVGSGVQVDDIHRLFDEGIERRLRTQLGLAGGASFEHRAWQEIQGVLAEPDAGISSALGDLFARIDRLKTEPSDRALRGGVVQGATALAQAFNLLAARLGDTRAAVFGEVRGLVQQVNEHAQAIAALNREITSLEAGGRSANDLRDAREQHVKEISKLLDTRAIERGNGNLDLIAGGHLLVSGTTTTPLRVALADERTVVHAGASVQSVAITGGRIGALLRHEAQHIPQLLGDADRLARELALQFNRVQTTGVPRSGPFQSLTSYYGAVDGDGDGQRGDELLAQSGFPFDVHRGELWITVQNRRTGDLERTRLQVDPETMSLRDLAAAIDGIEHLSASVDPTGRLQISADAGYGFDFGSRLDPSPDSFGSFGGAAPSLASAGPGPFALTVPASFTVHVDGTPHTVNLTASDFRNPGAATAAELAAAINAQLAGTATAREVGGRLVLRSDTSGAGATLSLTDGAGGPLAAIGLPVGTTATGQANAVAIEVAGTYTGSDNRRLVFRPDGDGEIGATPGLTIGVFDERGNRLATLAVGAGVYEPGKPLAVMDGITVSFGGGRVSAANGDVFTLDALHDPDTTDLLAAIGMNTLFVGSDAATLAVNDAIAADPELLAAGTSGAAGDAGNLDRLLALRSLRLDGLGTANFEDFWADVVGEVGFSASAAEATAAAQDDLLAALEAQRAQVSGVDLDEE